MDTYDVTAAVVDKDEVVLALFDQRYNSVMIIKPVITKDEGNNDVATFSISEPDGADRIYWLEKFGIISEEEFQSEAEKLAGEIEKVKLFERLKKELGR